MTKKEKKGGGSPERVDQVEFWELVQVENSRSEPGDQDVGLLVKRSGGQVVEIPFFVEKMPKKRSKRRYLSRQCYCIPDKLTFLIWSYMLYCFISAQESEIQFSQYISLKKKIDANV